MSSYTTRFQSTRISSQSCPISTQLQASLQIQGPNEADNSLQVAHSVEDLRPSPGQAWPLLDKNRVLIHLHPLNASLLRDGETFFHASSTSDGRVCIVFCHVTDEHGIEETTILTADYAKLRQMDWFHNVNMENDDDLSSLLTHCLQEVQHNLESICLDGIHISVHDVDITSSDVCQQTDFSDMHEDNNIGSTISQNGVKLSHLSISKEAGSTSTRDQSEGCHHPPWRQRHQSTMVPTPVHSRCEQKMTNRPESIATQPQVSGCNSERSTMTWQHTPLPSGCACCEQKLTVPPQCECCKQKLSRPSQCSCCRHSLSQPRGCACCGQSARSLHQFGADGNPVREETPLTCPKTSTPGSIHEIESQVSQSGVAIYTGSCDNRGCVLILIFCKHAGWSAERFCTTELARLLLYYRSLPKEEVRSQGSTLVVDARGTTLPILNALLTSIYTVQENDPSAISIVHVLTDRIAQSLLFRSPVFRPQVNIKIDLVTNVETMFRFVEPNQLPASMGGTLDHSHHHWVKFRMELEPFLSSCRKVGQFLVKVMHEMTALDGIPAAARQAQNLIDRHEECMRNAIEDPELVKLQEEGESVIAKLHEMSKELCECDDYKESLSSAERLYKRVKESVFRLVKLADTRLQKLEQILQLRQFEESSSEVIGWLTKDGEEMLLANHTPSENLRGIRLQQKDFDKLYFTAMRQLERGSDLLEEASMLTQSGHLDQVTGIKEVTRQLKTHMRSFSDRLDDVKENIDNTGKCYQLLDQSYEWALEAMKYVTTMKVDRSATPEMVEQLISSLDIYLEEHPPIPSETFDEMMELAEKLGHTKLMEQCKTARQRCLETSQLLQVRRSTLQRAREHMEGEQQRRRSSFSPGSLSFYGIEYDSMASFMARRRSYAGKPSAPMYSPAAAAFRETARDLNLTEYEEHLFNEGLITEDMSDRIVTCLPKGLSDSTLRSSRESLRGSRESLHGSSENLLQDTKSTSLPRDLPASLPTSCTSNLHTTLNKHNKPMKKILRRCSTGSDEIATANLAAAADARCADKRNSRGLSMITGSTESLPSISEEEQLEYRGSFRRPANLRWCQSWSGPASQQNGSRDERRHIEESDDRLHPANEPEPIVRPHSDSEPKMWTPVPINTNLASQGKRVGGLTSFHSMADLRLTDEEIKRRKSLAMIMKEMIQTEKDYIRALGLIIENYMPEMLREDIPQPLRGKRNVIFGNIEKIYEFHSMHFLQELEQCEHIPFQICHIFQAHVDEFYLYALYNKNKPRSDELMADYGNKFFQEKQKELGHRLDLSSYLLKPVQRMGKYALLLKQIIKECPANEPEYAELQAALEMVKFQLRHGNDLLAMDSLRDCDVSLQEQGQLLRQEEFIVWQGRKKSLRRVFLFEDLLVLSKPKRSSGGHDTYIYKNSIKTADLGLTENVVQGVGFRFEIWFRKRKSAIVYTLQAQSQEVKMAWVRDISRLLWKQAIKNRELRMAEMVNMGLGSKPCLDLKPSKDNIQDRFVNVNVQNKVPRSRNSIAVSSVEHLKNGKRPHSIISVSSTSSSNSSQSSGYTQHVHPGLTVSMETRAAQSATISSNESGICADISALSACTDAFTQTTLKRGTSSRDSGISRDSGVGTDCVSSVDLGDASRLGTDV